MPDIEKVYLQNPETNAPQAPRTITEQVVDTVKNRSLKESLTKLTEYQSLGFSAFSTSVNYAEGDPCFHDRRLWKAKAGGHPAGVWNSAHFEEFSVKEYVDAQTSVFDVTAKNPTAGPNSDGKFTLEYILSNANTLIPAPFRRGGISISFVQSSDSKYVQYRYMGIEITGTPNPFLNTDNWEEISITVNAINSNTQSILDISDERENVLIRFKNGHIQTEKFNSENIQIEPSNGGFSILDGNGDAVLMIEHGEIFTKKFASGNKDSNQWKNRIIAWYGTSIPAGYPNQNNQNNYAYPNIIAQKLGAKILNYSVPNGVIRATKHNGDPLSTQRLNLSFTKLTSPINYQNSMLDLIGTINEPDLFVFDYGVNDYGEDDTEWDSPIDFDSRSTNDFIGSYAFVINSLLTAKPNARIIILTHYTDANINPQSIHYGKIGCKPLNDRIEDFANYWCINLINGRRFIGWNYLNMQYYAKDYIHPASSDNVMSVNMLANNYYQIIKKFY